MAELIDLQSPRARQARLGKAIGKTGYIVLLSVAGLALIGSLICFIGIGAGPGLLLLALALLCWMPAIWWRRQLSILPAEGGSLTGRLAADVLQPLKPGQALTPLSLWQALSTHWQLNFLRNHLLLPDDLVTQHLGQDEQALAAALTAAEQLADSVPSQTIEPVFIAAGLLLSEPALGPLLTHMKLTPEVIREVANWLGRNLAEERMRTQKYGGIGRDWAFGYTPLLDRFGHNISEGIMHNGAHFGWLTESAGVKALETALTNRNDAVALIGPEGIGKSSSVYALAQRLIEGKTGRALAYHQIIGLNATDITSAARSPGDLENLMVRLANEAAHAAHIMLFFDDAMAFFSERPGAFDAGQILLSLVQARIVPIILALTPAEFQRLKSRDPGLANQLTPVVLQELPEEGVMRVLEDTAIGLEHRFQLLIAYQALQEAYRLSGRYEQEEAYPGKAIKLLEQAVNHAEHSVVTAQSVQQAIEQTRGVKVGSAAPAEADALLHLEDLIHERMINQTAAVQAVAGALRRARAGVANPRRPIGSFLFLGPTGVGKTELAKAVAAIYFNHEASMIRLDMSEYQQPDDVQRLLATGNNSNSLLLNVRQQPFSVVLLDEVEKAHPNILNLLLQLLDEGQLTDLSGRAVSFKDCVIIATSNAGAATIRERVAAGQALESFSEELTDELIKSGQFKPELLNRFDEIVLFRPLTADELAQVVRLMLVEINQTLANQHISVGLTDAAIQHIVQQGNDPRLGARPMRRTLQKTVENTVAAKILRGEAQAGDRLLLDTADLQSS